MVNILGRKSLEIAQLIYAISKPQYPSAMSFAEEILRASENAKTTKIIAPIVMVL